MKKILEIIVGLIVVIFMVIGAKSVFMDAGVDKSFIVHDRVFSAGEIKNDILKVQELATASYTYETVGHLRDKKKIFGYGLPMTEKQLIIIFNGVIKYGYDLSSVSEQDIRIDGKNITVKLPKPQILSNEVDTNNYKVVLADGRFFNGLNPEDALDAAEIAKKKSARRALASEELNKIAVSNAKSIIAMFLKSRDNSLNITFED